MGTLVSVELPMDQLPPAVRRALQAAGVETLPVSPWDELVEKRIPLDPAFAGVIALGRVVGQLPAPADFRRRVRETAALIVDGLRRTAAGRLDGGRFERRRQKALARAQIVVEECERLWPETP